MPGCSSIVDVVVVEVGVDSFEQYFVFYYALCFQFSPFYHRHHRK